MLFVDKFGFRKRAEFVVHSDLLFLTSCRPTKNAGREKADDLSRRPSPDFIVCAAGRFPGCGPVLPLSQGRAQF